MQCPKRYQIYGQFIGLIFVFVSVNGWVYAASSAGATNVNQSISQIIKEIRNETSTIQRTEHAYRLRQAIGKVAPEEISDNVIADLGNLLEDRDDSVRAWVAASLAKIGPRAKQTIPALEVALKKIECVYGSLTSEPAIRSALTNLGKNPPEPECPPK
jgi:HEAT repeat protein